MPVVLLIILIIALGIFSFVLVMETYLGHNDEAKTSAIITSLVFVPLLIWLIGASTRDSKFTTTKESVKLENVCEYKEISYQVVKDGPDVINITQRLGKIIRDNKITRIKNVNSGWHCGVYFGSKEHISYEEDK